MNDISLAPHQLIYASSATTPLSSEELAELLEVARSNNHSVRISGMLVYHDACFLQVLEGPHVAVQAVFDRIKTDPRHSNVRILLQRDIEKKEFEDWSMAFVDGSGALDARDGFIDYLKKLENRVVGDSPSHKVLRSFQEGNWREKILEEEVA